MDQSNGLIDALKSHGVPYEAKIFPETKSNIENKKQQLDWWLLVEAFLEKNMG
jgi:dipeptidyl aminopeptidase/acylaminoacyl peptidase